MLFFLLLPSCIIVPKRELVNTLNPSTSKPQNNQLYYSKQHSMDIETKLSREQFSSPSMNSLKEISVNFATSSMEYAEHLQTQPGNLT